MTFDDLLTDSLIVVGTILVGYGLWLVFTPLVYVWFGAMALAVGLMRLWR